ncbi:MAG: hypothetical protein RLZZ08_172 [Pseudomonadota bacterium]|jgi:hypothetical protein
MRLFPVAAGVLASALALAWASCASAQPAPPPPSPVPEGVREGAGAANPKGQYAKLDALPDWGGIWFVTFDRNGPPPAQPKLKGDYAAQWDKWKADLAAHDGQVTRARSNCSPPGLPRIMQLAQYPYEFLFTPGRVTINQEAWMQTRTVWTDGRSHPPLEELDPTFHGHSIGHWEGDVLVVDTIGISDQLEFGTGARHSDKFHLVERIHLDPAKPDALVNEMVMDDPEALAEPFTATVRYRRDRYGQVIEFECSENDRNPVNEAGETEYR